MHAWCNGSFVEPDSPAISVLDHGLTVGDGVFEAIKVVDNVPFALTRHLRRMLRSAAGLGLPAPDPDVVRRAITAVLDAERIDLGRLRITWTAGPSPLGSGRDPAGEPTLVVASAAMKPFDPGVAIVTVPWPRNEKGALAGLKTTSYAENVVALARAHEQGAGEAIFANTAGNLCEGTGSNIFYVVEGELRTPTLESGCLAGISRELLLEWMDVVQVDEPVGVLDRAEEMFLVSTTRDVQAVHACDGRELPAPGPVTQEAAEVWAAREPEHSDP
jgi:branched-chain amino acid aminotransferase